MSKEMIEYVAYSGKQFIIEWYYNKNKKSDALKYYQSLSDAERRAVLALLLTMGNIGEMLNSTKFRSEGDKIYAFKTEQERFLCFFCHGKKIIITNGFRKKSQKLPLKEKEKATNRHADYLKRVANGEYYE